LKQSVKASGDSSVKMPDQPPKLDIRVRILFDEDLRSLNFPKIKEYLFRANKGSTLELAAKALSLKNQHPEKWTNY
jgi:hypothetical protein